MEHVQPGMGWEPGIAAGMRNLSASKRSLGWGWGWESEPRALGRGRMPRHAHQPVTTFPWRSNDNKIVAHKVPSSPTNLLRVGSAVDEKPETLGN